MGHSSMTKCHDKNITILQINNENGIP